MPRFDLDTDRDTWRAEQDHADRHEVVAYPDLSDANGPTPPYLCREGCGYAWWTSDGRAAHEKGCDGTSAWQAVELPDDFWGEAS